MEELDSHFDNLTAVSTNRHAALDQLVSATREQYTRITATLDNLVAAANSKPSPRSIPRTTNPLSPTEKCVIVKIILTLKSAVKDKWKVGGFCSTHGHSICAGHDSGNFSNNNDGHDVTSTRSNPVGTGKDFNKGWDAW